MDRFFSHWRYGKHVFPDNCTHNELRFGQMCFLALILFACLRLLDQLPKSAWVSRYAGVAAVVMGPLFTPIFLGRHLQANRLYGYTDEGHLDVAGWVRVLECAAVLTLLYLYALRSRRAPTAAPILLPAIHGVFWFAVLVGADWQAFVTAVCQFLLLPLAASVIWVFNVRFLRTASSRGSAAL